MSLFYKSDPLSLDRNRSTRAIFEFQASDVGRATTPSCCFSIAKEASGTDGMVCDEIMLSLPTGIEYSHSISYTVKTYV